METGMRLAEMPDVLTVQEVAHFLRLSPASAYEALRQKKIPSVRIGRRVLVPKKALLVLLEAAEE